MDFDYSYYLGPKWRQELEKRDRKAPTIISNHSSLLDGFIPHTNEPIMLVARSNLAKIPGIGQTLIGLECIFINRLGPRDQLKKRAMDISDR